MGFHASKNQVENLIALLDGYFNGEFGGQHINVNVFCKKHNIPLIRIPYTDFEKIDVGYLTQRIYNTSIEV